MKNNNDLKKKVLAAMAQEPALDNTQAVTNNNLDKTKNGTSNDSEDKATLMAKAYSALSLADDIISKKYLLSLAKLDVKELDVSNGLEDDIPYFFKITEMVYEKDEFAGYKLTSVFNALSLFTCTIYLLLNSDGIKTDFFMGVRSASDIMPTGEIMDELRGGITGQFPGTKTVDYETEKLKELLETFKDKAISVASCIADMRAEDLNNNTDFVQGLEKFVRSMQGKKYTAIVISDTTNTSQLQELRRTYENIYTQLTPLALKQFNYGETVNNGENYLFGINDNTNITESNMTTITKGEFTSHSISKENTAAKVVKGLAAVSAYLGLVYAPATLGASLITGAMESTALGFLSSAISEQSTDTTGVNTASSVANGTAKTKGSGRSFSKGSNYNEGKSSSITFSVHNKAIENIMSRIDKQLQRLENFESHGMFECAAYFLSDEPATAATGASIYKAIMSGKNTSVETTAINTWSNISNNLANEDSDDYKENQRMLKNRSLIEDYILNFRHPVFTYGKITKGNDTQDLEVTPSVLISGSELSLHMGLPRQSVNGLPVIEHISFGKEVLSYDNIINQDIKLGHIFDMGQKCNNEVALDLQSLPMHVFVTGSTGSGKSNTIYQLIDQVKDKVWGDTGNSISFMIIEPTKGEYKNVFGGYNDVKVYGSNPAFTELLKINPFKFPDKVHVLEHIDRLMEIFNACWAMYAAMPAILKEALLRAYKECGWDLVNSRNRYGDNFYPSFIDLQNELNDVIAGSAYSDEVKSNYLGSLATRVNDLTNGLNGNIFAGDEIPEDELFDKNVIIDLSRIGSMDTKSLIMGILVMRLNEHRISIGGMNEKLKHITVLEEAHNLLRRVSFEQDSEKPNIAGKSVEMIANAIAEMRTYGESFIIVDQSPSAVDASAIRNTNTKIIMRLPDEADRRYAGKSLGLKDIQLDEIAKLPQGVALVCQNNWVEPVLCKIEKFSRKNGDYKPPSDSVQLDMTPLLKKRLLELLLNKRISQPLEKLEPYMKDIHDLFGNAVISTKSKIGIKLLLDSYEERKELTIWKDERFFELASLINSILDGDKWVKRVIDNSAEFEELTNNMIERIEYEVPGIDKEYALAVIQCILRKQADNTDEFKNLYSAWITDIRKRGVF